LRVLFRELPVGTPGGGGGGVRPKKMPVGVFKLLVEMNK
jgi:hypothetical protein